MKKIMTAHELLKIVRKGRPEAKYVTNDKQNTIGVWVEDLGRYVAVAGKLLTGDWSEMPYELLVNGEPIPIKWEE